MTLFWLLYAKSINQRHSGVSPFNAALLFRVSVKKISKCMTKNFKSYSKAVVQIGCHLFNPLFAL